MRCTAPTIRRLARDRRGNVVTLLALALPVLGLAASAAIDYGRLASGRQALQKAADAAALAAARELLVSSAGDEARINAVVGSVARAQLGLAAGDASLAVEARPSASEASVAVTLSRAAEPSALGFLAGVERTLEARATARRVGGGKLCVLVLSLKDADENEVIKLEGEARLTGQDCGVYSNSRGREGVNVKDGAVITGSTICSAGGYKDPSSTRYVGTRLTDCPVIENPLKDRPAPIPGTCKHKDSSGKPVKLVIDSSRDLPAGTYCEGIEIKGKGTVVTLRESGGDNVLIVKDGLLKVTDDAKLTGRGVGIAFAGESASFEFTGTSTIDLHGPTAGPLAGVLFFGSPDAPDWREYKITSNNARVLVGTIYLPKGFFTVDAKNPVADLSAYTAVIVNKLNLKDAPKLVLNTNYHQTQVPVPKGVAAMTGTTALVR